MNTFTVRFDLRWVVGLLLVVIAVMFVVWKPWLGSSGRTITSTGEATVKAEPDEFIFSPTYQKEADTSSAAISEVSTVGNEVVAKLKELGIEEKSITTQVSTNQGFEPMTGRQTDKYTAQYSITAKVNDKEVAQKAFDYIVTSSPLYGVSPQSTFTTETRKKLENTARLKAVADAKDKVAQTANELEVRVGRVVSVSEPQWGGPIPFAVSDKAVMEGGSTSSTATPVLLTGEQEVTYSVSVVFRIH